jgi:hypothetical protein
MLWSNSNNQIPLLSCTKIDCDLHSQVTMVLVLHGSSLNHQNNHTLGFSNTPWSWSLQLAPRPSHWRTRCASTTSCLMYVSETWGTELGLQWRLRGEGETWRHLTARPYLHLECNEVEADDGSLIRAREYDTNDNCDHACVETFRARILGNGGEGANKGV